MIRDVKPVLAVIDPLGALFPAAEDKNVEANSAYARLRRLMSDCGCSPLVSHHRKKPNDKRAVPRLERTPIHNWFMDARGATALINGSDIRIAVDRPVPRKAANQKDEVAMVLGGFGRVRGEFPLVHLTRVRDKSGQPLGYRCLGGAGLLRNPHQERAYEQLPNRFRFMEAKRVYGKGSQATSDWLNRCIEVGILRVSPDGAYEKVELADLTD
jgi:hypothetical protein